MTKENKVREFELIIDEAIKKGLTPLSITQTGEQWLNECLGFRCGKGELELYEELDNDIPAAVDMHYNWPFPQFVAGERYNFMIVRDSLIAEDIVYVVSDDQATVTQIFAVDALTFGTGTLMEVADFGEYAIMINGVVMVFWNVLGTAWNASVETATVPLMRTICNFKGQAVGGGVTTVWHDCDETFYIWSKIGNLDFTPGEGNEAGYRRCPYGGNVYHTRRLGDNIIGYSSKGITALQPVTEPVPSFGFIELLDVGLINQGAMNGNLSKQVFVGDDHIVREITSQGIKELGYDYYMKRLSGEDIIVSYDPANRDFYIGNSTMTFLLSPYGMTEVPQHPSAVWRREKETFMIPKAIDSYEALIVSNTEDMGYGGEKTIFSMESDILVADDVQAAVDYYTSLDSYGMSDYVPLNNQGVASIIVSGNKFRFRLKFDPFYDNTRISYIKARYKMTDLRGIRGVYAPPPRGQ